MDEMNTKDDFLQNIIDTANEMINAMINAKIEEKLKEDDPDLETLDDADTEAFMHVDGLGYDIERIEAVLEKSIATPAGEAAIRAALDALYAQLEDAEIARAATKHAVSEAWAAHDREKLRATAAAVDAVAAAFAATHQRERNG